MLMHFRAARRQCCERGAWRIDEMAEPMSTGLAFEHRCHRALRMLEPAASWGVRESRQLGLSFICAQGPDSITRF